MYTGQTDGYRHDYAREDWLEEMHIRADLLLTRALRAGTPFSDDLVAATIDRAVDSMTNWLET